MYSVREFVTKVFERLDLDWKQHVRIDPRYFRPTEVTALRGDASKAERLLGWRPRVDFDELVALMVDSDLDLARQERALVEAGHCVRPRGLASA